MDDLCNHAIFKENSAICEHGESHRMCHDCSGNLGFRLVLLCLRSVHLRGRHKRLLVIQQNSLGADKFTGLVAHATGDSACVWSRFAVTVEDSVKW